MSNRTIRRADQIPPHVYSVPQSISKLLTGGRAFQAFMQSVVEDIDADLKDISDKATQRNYHRTSLHAAMLNKQFSEALYSIERIKEAEEKEPAQLVCGILERAIIEAVRVPPGTPAKFSAAFEKELVVLPFDRIETELKTLKRRLEILSPNLYMGVVEEQLDPAAKNGAVSMDIARRAIEIKFLLEVVLPFKYAAVDVLANILAANRRDKPDIWAEREVHLDETDSLHPVVVAIWDGGTDTSVFPTQFSRNKNDDRVLAWAWSGDRAAGPLRDVVLRPEEIAESKRFTKGSNDMRYNIDSPEASAFRKHLSALPKDDVKRFLENLQFYLTYAHGTHVAGIALRGSSWMHPLIARIDWPYQLIRPTPTLDWAEKYAGVMRETIAFFKSHGARVANLSWSCYTPKEIEHDLESNAQGASPEERRATARRLFDLVSRAFYEAIAGAPDILFVTAAGNTNSDVRFDEAIPSCFDLPNIISVGAVDQAGEETAFTSLGKVDVYANGCEIESLVPGGETQAWSGTSQAAPQVTALAGKLLAKYPRLTTLQLRQLILDGASLKTLCGDREIRLLNPRRSFELAATKPLRRRPREGALSAGVP